MYKIKRSMFYMKQDKIYRSSGLGEFRIGRALDSHIDLLTSIE